MKIAVILMIVICSGFPRRGPVEKPAPLSYSHLLYLRANSFKNYQDEKINNIFIFIDGLAPIYSSLRSKGVIFFLFYLVTFLFSFRMFFKFCKKLLTLLPPRSYQPPTNFLSNLSPTPLPQPSPTPPSTPKCSLSTLTTSISFLHHSLLEFQTQILTTHSQIWVSLSFSPPTQSSLNPLSHTPLSNN